MEHECSISQFVKSYENMVSFSRILKKQQPSSAYDVAMSICEFVLHHRNSSSNDLTALKFSDYCSLVKKTETIQYTAAFKKLLRLTNFYVNQRRKICTIRMQAIYRGYRVRTHVKSSLRMWTHVRFALAHLFRGRFQCEEEDTQRDDEAAVVSFMNSLYGMMKECPIFDENMATLTRDRIKREIDRCHQVVNMLDTLAGLLSSKAEKRSIEALRSSIYPLLQQAHVYDKEMDLAMESGVYAFDPRDDEDDSHPTRIQSTTECSRALLIYEALCTCDEKLQVELALLYENELVADNIDEIISSVETLEIGPVIEVCSARERVAHCRDLITKLTKACERNNIADIQKAYDDAVKEGLQWTNVYNTKIILLEHKLRTQLNDALASKNMKELLRAIDASTKALIEEADNAKLHHQAMVRLKWMRNKESSSNNNVMVQERTYRKLNLDHLISLASECVANECKTNNRKSASKYIDTIATKQSNVLVATLNEATSVRQNIRDVTENNARYLEQENVRKMMFATMIEIDGKLKMYVQDRRTRENSRHLSKAPMRTKRYKPARVLGSELKGLFAQIDAVLWQGVAVGLDKDLEKLSEQASISDDELEDAKIITDLKNYMLELDDWSKEYDKIQIAIRRATQGVATCADKGKSDEDLARLKKTLKRTLRVARIGCAPERQLVPMQYAYDALRSENSAMLAQAVKNANRLLPSLSCPDDDDNNGTDGNNNRKRVSLKRRQDSTRRLSDQRRASLACSLDPVADIRLFEDLKTRLSTDELDKLKQHLSVSNTHKQELLVQVTNPIETTVRKHGHRRSQSVALDFIGNEEASVIQQQQRASYVHQLLLVAHHAKRVIDAVLDNASKCSDDEPQHKQDDDDGQAKILYEGDVSVVAILLEDVLKQCPNDQSIDEGAVTWARKQLDALKAIVQDFRAISAEVSNIIVEVSSYPFSTRRNALQPPKRATNDELYELQDRMLAVLQKGRHIGLPGARLQYLVNECDHIQIFLEARHEAMNDVENYVKKMRKLQSLHQLDDAHDTLHGVNSHEFAQNIQLQEIECDSLCDADLLSLCKKVATCVDDCELVAFPVTDIITEMTRLYDKLCDYIEARMMLRKILYSQQSVDICTNTNSFALLYQLCEKAGLTEATLQRSESENFRTLRKVKKIRSELGTKKLNSKAIHDVATTKYHRNNNDNNVNNNYNNSSNKLNFAEIRKQLRDAMDSHNVEALDNAIAEARKTII